MLTAVIKIGAPVGCHFLFNPKKETIVDELVCTAVIEEFIGSVSAQVPLLRPERMFDFDLRSHAPAILFIFADAIFDPGAQSDFRTLDRNTNCRQEAGT